MQQQRQKIVADDEKVRRARSSRTTTPDEEEEALSWQPPPRGRRPVRTMGRRPPLWRCFTNSMPSASFFITSSIHFPRTCAPRRVFPRSAPFRIRVACWARRRRRRNGQCSDSRCNRPLVLEGYGIPALSTSRNFLRSLDVSFCSRADRFNASATNHSADA